MKTKSIYADYNATSPLDPKVLEAMLPYFDQKFGNASSSTHEWGWEAQLAVENSRNIISHFFEAEPNELFFTSGATESNNIALESFLRAFFSDDQNSILEPHSYHFISSPLEHPSVKITLQETLNRYNQLFQSFRKKPLLELEWVAPDNFGCISIDEVNKRIRPNTIWMSFMWVHNEYGTINPISQLAELAHKNRIYFHTDATAAIGKIPNQEFSLKKAPVDMLSFSAHKIYGPKGIGGLYVRKRSPKVLLDPFLYGGGQEQGLRSGTLNTPSIVGMAQCFSLLIEGENAELDHLRELRDELWEKLSSHFGNRISRNSSLESSDNVSHLLHITFHEALGLPARIPGLACSKSSACHSEGFHIDKTKMNSLRISFGRFSKSTDPQGIFECIVKSLKA